MAWYNIIAIQSLKKNVADLPPPLEQIPTVWKQTDVLLCQYLNNGSIQKLELLYVL